MIFSHSSGDAGASLLERRWFAASKSAMELRGECEVLREVMEMSQTAWQSAVRQLKELELLSESLGGELAARDAERELVGCGRADRGISSAA